jgi:hypothetical protein
LGKLTLNGATDSNIKLTRITNTTMPTPQPKDPYTWDTSDPNMRLFWIINLQGSEGNDPQLANLDVWYSWAYSKPAPKTSTVQAPWQVPLAQWCINWTELARILFSFAEDAIGDNGLPGANGRLDRIRVQASRTMNGDFSGFPVEIDQDYTIDTSRAWLNPADGKTYYGFSLLPSSTDTMVIYLKEKDAPDGGISPTWWIKDGNNTTLRQSVSPFALFAIPGDGKMTALDTVPPRIAYSLAVPAVPEFYIRFTEPVRVSSLPGTGTLLQVTKNIHFAGNPTPLDVQKFPDESGNPADYATEFLIPLDKAFDAEDLVDGITYLEDIFRAVRDVPPNPYEWPADKESGQREGTTTYPLDYDYNAYVDFNTVSETFPDAIGEKTNIGQPNTFRTGSSGTYDSGAEHRISDVLIMEKPGSAIDPSLSMWPVYAKDISGVMGTKLGTAQFFDGSEKIWRKEISVEAISDDTITEYSLSANPELLFSINIPSEYHAQGDYYRNPGLWLPKRLNLTPMPFNQSIVKAITQAKDNHWWWKIPEDDLTQNGLLEFVFSFPLPNFSPSKGPLYGVRLASTAGIIPENWYHKLENFKFGVQSIAYQRSGATIVNNVINPLLGEETVLNYILTSGGQVTIQVFALDGTLIKNLYRGSREAGEWAAVWNGKNNGGNPVARGMYFIRIVAPDIDEIRKVMVVK